MATPRTVAFHTLGCKLNFSESSMIQQQFLDNGYGVNSFDEGADIFVINTCSVTEFADKKCKKVVKKALSVSPHAFVVVTGCYAQLKPTEISEINGVDLVLGASEKFQILKHVDNLQKANDKGMVISSDINTVDTFENAFSFGNRTRSFLKIQDGCDYKCTFCTIPLARGKSRSNTLENVVNDAKLLASKGVKEIVLTGVNIGDFGNGTSVIEGERPKKEALFIDLIKALDKVEGIERFRISSIEPNLCTDEIIEFVARSERFAAHLHLPLQSGNNKQLKAMKRRYTKELYSSRVKKIRQMMYQCCIGVDVIVGFPGETDEDFLETYEFLENLDVNYLHVFTYSERPNTPAIDMDEVVPMNKRRKRSEMLRALSIKKKRKFYSNFLGLGRDVLFEVHKDKSKMTGFTDNYIKVETEFQEGMINTVGRVQLMSINDDNVVQSIVMELPEEIFDLV